MNKTQNQKQQHEFINESKQFVTMHSTHIVKIGLIRHVTNLFVCTLRTSLVV